MNDDHVHALFSKASEAVISEDGKVKRRLKNYETVVGRDVDDSAFTPIIPIGAVNDTYGNLDSFTHALNTAAKVSHIRYAMYATLALVLAGFVWSLYSFISPVGRGYDGEQQPIASDEVNGQSVNASQLERIANLVIRDGDWSDARIKKFLHHWNNSDQSTRTILKKQAWYQQFTFRLHNRFQQARHRGVFVNYQGDANRHPLLALALATGVAHPDEDYSVAQKDSPDYAALAEEVEQELAKVEQARISNSYREQKIKNESIAKVNQTATDFPGSEAAHSNKKTNGAKIKTVSVPIINKQDIADILQKYAVAYEQGDMKQLSSLFGVNDPATGKQIVAQLKQNYQTIFNNSDIRKVQFNSLDWQMQDNRAIVNSDYHAEITLKNNKGTQTVTANANVEMKKAGNNVQISRFQLLNQKVSVITPELQLSSTRNFSRPQSPTAAELQDIVTRFVSAYESGDIDLFTSLFAKDAKTNDQTSLNGIKRDYEQLFANTTDRQMFIQNMQWAFNDTQAQGSGNLEAIVFTKTGDPVSSISGDIEIRAQRFSDKVLITHLYHTESVK